MKRDKTISVKVNSQLLEEFNKIVKQNTNKWQYSGRVFYDCYFSDNFCRGKFTLGDLLEKSIQDFINKNNNTGC